MTMQLQSLMPHTKPMRMLDSIIKIDNQSSVCSVTISTHNPFYDSDINGIYAWVGIELMGQSIAVFAGYQMQQQPPQTGLLLSVRKFSSDYAYYKLGQELTIIADKIYLEGKVGVFNCRIMLDDKVIASAKLNTYQPEQQQLNRILQGEPA